MLLHRSTSYILCIVYLRNIRIGLLLVLHLIILLFYCVILCLCRFVYIHREIYKFILLDIVILLIDHVCYTHTMINAV